MIWRGPHGDLGLDPDAARGRVGALDVMVVDMPPGTGDAQLTMAAGAAQGRRHRLHAQIRVDRWAARHRDALQGQCAGARHHREHERYFLCPHCGNRSDIFGHGGARHEAERLGVPFLGEVPLHMDIREKSDAGLPVVATAPDSPLAAVYREMAARVRDQIKGATSVAPNIVIEA